MDVDTTANWVTLGEPFFLWYFGLLNLFYTFLIVLGSYKVYLRRKELREENFFSILQSNFLPEIAFIIPMFNEEKNIVSSVESLLRLTYRYKKIFIVNDGSQDKSFEITIQTFDMVPIPFAYEMEIETKEIRQVYQSRKHPEILFIDKEHSGKADSINAGLNVSESPYFLVVDADTVLENSGFEALIRPILIDPKTIAVGAGVRIQNGCTVDYNRVDTKGFPRKWIVATQAMEYLRVFLTREGWDWFNGNFIVAGAFALFPRELICKLGGFCESVGEDVEIIMRLHRYMKEIKSPYQISYIPDPVAWTLVP